MTFALFFAAPTKKRKQWSDESMIRALDAIIEGIPVNRTVELYCVPRSTLVFFFFFFSIKVYASAKDTQLASSANIGVYPDKTKQ